jgi:hypothetical protein
MLYSTDLTVLNLAVPSLTEDLKPSASQLLWIVDIYGFLVAGSLIIMGTLGDRIGRRRLLIIGAAAFGVASVSPPPREVRGCSSRHARSSALPERPWRRRRCRSSATCSSTRASAAHGGMEK